MTWRGLPIRFLWLAWALCLATGCGATKLRTATEQLLMSDAIDRAVAQVDFSALANQKVFFDHKYIQNSRDPQVMMKGFGFVNSDYVVSSLRQQMVAAGLLLQDKLDDADYIIEARLGAIGTDNNEVLFGIPATNLFSTAQVVMPTAPAIPAIPEIAFAKRNVLLGAAKIGVFAYHRETRSPVWQSGISKASSTARDTWVLGAGPFQAGTIYEGTQFAGSRLAMPIPLRTADPEAERPPPEIPISYYNEHLFGPRPLGIVEEQVQPVGYQAPLTPPPPPGAPSGGTTPPASSPPAAAGSVVPAGGPATAGSNAPAGTPTIVPPVPPNAAGAPPPAPPPPAVSRGKT